MANPTAPKKRPPPTNGFKKGKSGNPQGSSAKSRTNSALKRLTADEVGQVGTMLLEGNLSGLQNLARDTDASVLKVWTAAIIVRSMRTGDVQAYKVILDRIVGKCRESIELTGRDGNPLEMNVARGDMSEADMIARADQLAAMRREVGDD